MGQKIGKAQYHPNMQPFINLSRESIVTMWKYFDEYNIGLSVSKEELTEVLSYIHYELNIHIVSTKTAVKQLYDLFDCYHHGIIDSIEVCVTIATLSSMKFNEIFYYILHMYDFDCNSMLTSNDIVLCFKTLCGGLAKVCLQEGSVDEESIYRLVSKIYTDEFGLQFHDNSKLPISRLVEIFLIHPDIFSWYAYYVDLRTYSSCDVSFEDHMCSHNESLSQWRITQPTNHQLDPSQHPWLTTIHSLPAAVKYEDNHLILTGGLNLDWIFGYQSDICDNNVDYNCEGHVIYNAGRYIILYDPIQHNQRIFTSHQNEICRFRMHPHRKICVSGEFTKNSTVLVWDTLTLKVIFHVDLLSNHGPRYFAFSSNGNLLSIVSSDDYNTIFVYEWETKLLMYSSHIDRQPVISTTFLHDNTLVACSQHNVYYWMKLSDTYLKRDTIIGHHLPLDRIIDSKDGHIGYTGVVVIQQEHVIATTTTGYLLHFIERICSHAIKAHDGPIHTHSISSNYFITSGIDKKIRMWSTDGLQLYRTFDISSYGHHPTAKAVAISNDLSKLLFSTIEATIYEVSVSDGKNLHDGSLAYSHSTGKLNCLTVHPSQYEIITGGDDGNLMIWDLEKKTLSKLINLKNCITAVSYSYHGEHIGIGIGGSNPNTSGTIILLNHDDMTIVHQAKDTTSNITVMKFSPDGELLAVGTTHGTIYLYAITDGYELIGSCLRHTGSVRHIDFSTNSEWLRSNSTAKELYYFRCDDCSYQSNLSMTQYLTWATCTCVFENDIKAVQKSLWQSEYVTSLHHPTLSEIFIPAVVSSTNKGFLHIHPYPCWDLTSDNDYQRFHAHVGQIRCVRFTHDSKYIISIGEYDRTIMLWSYIPPSSSSTTTIAVSTAGGGKQDIVKIKPKDDFLLEGRTNSKYQEEVMPNNELETFLEESLHPHLPEKCHSWEEHSMTTHVSPLDLPQASLIIDHIYGSNPQIIRNHLCYLSTGDLLTISATFGIVIDKYSRRQRLFSQHHDKIIAFACTADSRYIATASIGCQLPQVMIWNPLNCEMITSLPMTSDTNINQLTFSTDQQYLALSYLDDRNSLTIYDWHERKIICQWSIGYHKTVFSMCFSSNDDILCVIGYQFIQFWKYIQTKHPCLLPLVMKDTLKGQLYTCCLYFMEICLIGGYDGNLLLIRNQCYTRSMKIKENSPIICLRKNKDGKKLCILTRDGFIKIINDQFDGLYEFTFGSTLPTGVQYTTLAASISGGSSGDCYGRGVCFNEDDTKIAILSSNGDLVECELEANKLLSNVAQLSSPGKMIMYDLATHPSKNEFLVVGEDALLRVYDSTTYKLIRTMRLDGVGRCLSYAPNERQIIVGFGHSITPNSMTAEDFYTPRGNQPITAKPTANTNTATAPSSRYSMRQSFSHRTQQPSANFQRQRLQQQQDAKHLAKIGSFAVYSMEEIRPEAIHHDKKHDTTTTSSSTSTVEIHKKKALIEKKVCNDSLTAIKWSRDMSYVACGSADGKIYVYEEGNNYSNRIGVFHCHKSAVISLDFSLNSSIIMSVDSEMTLRYSDIRDDGGEISSPLAFREELWSSFTAMIGLSVQGLWMKYCQDHEIITAACRSHNHLFLAVGTNCGRILITSYPAMEVRRAINASGHAGSVAKLAWSADDTTLISIGSIDGSIIQWKFNGYPSPSMTNNDNLDCTLLAYDNGLSYCHHLRAYHPTKISTNLSLGLQVQSRNAPTADIQLQYRVELEQCHGARLGDCRQCIYYNIDSNLLYISSTVIVLFNRYTGQQLAYQSHQYPVTCLCLTPSLTIVASGDQGSGGHDSEIDGNCEIHLWNSRTLTPIIQFKKIHRIGVHSLRFSSYGNVLVSLGQDPQHGIAVYRSHRGDWSDGIISFVCITGINKMLWVDYIENAKYPVMVGGENNVYLIRKVGKGMEKVPAKQSAKSQKDKIASISKTIFCCSCFVPADEELQATIESNRPVSASSRPKSSYFRRTPRPKSAAPPASNNELLDQYVAGSVTGHLYIWAIPPNNPNNPINSPTAAHADGDLLQCIPGHEAPIYCLLYSAIGLFSACKEGIIHQWNRQWSKIRTFNIRVMDPSLTVIHTKNNVEYACHSLAIDRACHKLSVGVRGGQMYGKLYPSSTAVIYHSNTCVVEISLSTFDILKLPHTHSPPGHMHGLTCNPANPDQYLTTGDDGILSIWSIIKSTCLAKTQLNAPCRTVTWSQDGLIIIVGAGDYTPGVIPSAKDGSILILDAVTLEILCEKRHSRRAITCIQLIHMKNPRDEHKGDLREMCYASTADGKLIIYEITRKQFDIVIQDKSVKSPSNKKSSSIVLSSNGIHFGLEVFDYSEVPLVAPDSNTADSMENRPKSPLSKLLASPTNRPMSPQTMLPPSPSKQSRNPFQFPSSPNQSSTAADVGISATVENKMIHSFDISADGQYCRLSVSTMYSSDQQGGLKEDHHMDPNGGRELYYYNAHTNEIFHTASNLVGITWKTSSVSLCYDVLGVWHDEIHTGRVTAMATCPNSTLIAVAYLHGMIRLYRYPCLLSKSPNAAYEYITIGSVIAYCNNLVFTPDGKYLIVLDCHCRSIMTYRIYDYGMMKTSQEKVPTSSNNSSINSMIVKRQ